jgi:hypothetical protein
MTSRLQKARRRVTAVIVGIATLILVMLMLVVLILLPYSPMTVYDYSPLSSPACPEKSVITLLEYELDEDSHVTTIEVESFWTAVDVPGVSNEQTVNRLQGTIISGVEGEVVEAEFVGPRPPTPGVWDARIEISVYGTAYGLPHVQQTETSFAEFVTVLPEGAPECEESS